MRPELSIAQLRKYSEELPSRLGGLFTLGLKLERATYRGSLAWCLQVGRRMGLALGGLNSHRI